MHGIVSFQQHLIQLSSDECFTHASESKRLIYTIDKCHNMKINLYNTISQPTISQVYS